MMDFTGLIGFGKLPVIMATCGDHSSSPAARGASGWHHGLSPGLPWPRAGARPSLQARAPGLSRAGARPSLQARAPGLSRAGARPSLQARAPGLSRAGGWHAWPARGAGTPCPRGGLARLARAVGWHAWPRARALPCGHRPGPRGDTTRSQLAPPL